MDRIFNSARKNKNLTSCTWDASWALNAQGGIRVNSLNLLSLLEQLDTPLEFLIRPQSINFIQKDGTAILNMLKFSEKNFLDKYQFIEPLVRFFPMKSNLRFPERDLDADFFARFRNNFLQDLPKFQRNFSINFSELSQNYLNIQTYRGNGIPKIKSQSTFHFSGDVIAPLVNNSTHLVRLHDAIPEIFPELSSYKHQRVHSQLLKVHSKKSNFLAVSSTAIEQAESALKTELKNAYVLNDPINFHQIKSESELYGDLEKFMKYRSDVEISRSVSEWKEKKIIVQIGPMEPKKNHKVVLDALEKYSENVLYVCITSAGWGARRSELRLLELVSSRKAVAFYDLPYRGVVNILSLADALVAPSLIEGYDRPPLEGLTFGCNVYASNIPAHKEMLPPNKVSIFNHVDELVDLISNTQKIPRPKREDRIKENVIALDHLSEKSIAHNLDAILRPL
jgi:glycosyltransferase involved in cell wall biosynthesis